MGLREARAGRRGDEDASGFGQIQSETRSSRPANGRPPLFITATVGSTHYRSDDWIVDVPLDELARWNSSGPPSGVGKLRMWAFQHHLQSVDNNCLELTVEGRTAQAVVLKQMRFHVLNRRPGSVPCGVRLDLSRLSLGASLNVRNFAVDLGSAEVAVPAPMPLQPYEFRLTPDFPYVVHRTDPERFYFSLDYGDEDIEWFAVLDWLSAGRSGSVRIDDAGAPFVSTAFRICRFAGGGSRWSTGAEAAGATVSVDAWPVSAPRRKDHGSATPNLPPRFRGTILKFLLTNGWRKLEIWSCSPLVSVVSGTPERSAVVTRVRCSSPVKRRSQRPRKDVIS